MLGRNYSSKRLLGYVAALKDNFGFIETANHDKEIFFHYRWMTILNYYYYIITIIIVCLFAAAGGVCFVAGAEFHKVDC